MHDRPISIFIPVTDIEKAFDFYLNTIGFRSDEHRCAMYLPGYDDSIEIQLQDISTSSAYCFYKDKKTKKFNIFTYFIEGSFLLYTQNLINSGVNFKYIYEHPGGYTAQVVDPFSNVFEYQSDDFDLGNRQSINPQEWERFSRM